MEKNELKAFGRAWEAVSIFLFAAASPLLWKLSLSRLSALVSRPVSRRILDPERLARTVRTVDAAVRWYRPLISSACLTRGVTLYWFLGGHGQDVELVFGVGQVRGNFAAHCWLELNDEPYLEKADPRQFFVEMYRFQRKTAGYKLQAPSRQGRGASEH